MKRNPRGFSAALVAGTCAFALAVRAPAQVDEEVARAWFGEAAALCEREGGRLWGVSLCGPMVFADAATGTIATSEPPPEEKRPPTLGFVNAPVEWGAKRWAAYVWPLIPNDDAAARGRLLLHELFHRVQPQLGLRVLGVPNDHLDTIEGRYWLQLEWRALALALTASGAERVEAVRDALTFRETRRSLFDGAAESERADEIREGLAQYTGTVAAAASKAEAIESAARQLAEMATASTWVRTFAYPSGVAYGLLLDAWAHGWTRRLRPADDLGHLLREAVGIEAAGDACPPRGVAADRPGRLGLVLPEGRGVDEACRSTPGSCHL